MNTKERNIKAKRYIESKIDIACNTTKSNFQSLPNYLQVESILDDLIFVKPMGFRGLVATAILGMYLDPKYDPLKNFYDCKPRALFEKVIFYSFQNRIPCGKSDPLNVAKNVNILDDGWIQGKRPQRAAQAVVDYLNCLKRASANEYDILVNFFFYKLIEYSEENKSEIKMPELTHPAQQDIAQRLTEFTLSYPEHGTVPQTVLSILLRQLYSHSSVSVKGGEESVFGTNTTSKKPADIWLEFAGVPTNLYEITVKTIDCKRLDDCIDSLNSIKMLDKDITFICRIPEDTKTLYSSSDKPQRGSYVKKYKKKNFNFIDIRSFICCTLSLLTKKDIEEIFEKFNSFINETNRPAHTKNGWKEIFFP